uniref:Neurotransmitter-gated ion-channel ligand-binding domain-containing protein n=1 Tax=Stomoxys calcitrans TaxID=35570 RepID=A0A1I8PJ48_STOCA
MKIAKNVFHILVALMTLSFDLTAADFKYNVSLTQMATCHHYVIPMSRGYNYADFFHVQKLKNNKLADNEVLHLKFYVMTARDAHILLSVTDHPRLVDKVYEIVIGAGRNTFSTIRTSMGRRRVATNQDANILSMLDYTPIEIIQTKDANLLVYITGFKEEPLMNFTDSSPLEINYISFTTYDNIPASWFYDCQFDGFDSELEEEVRPMTPMQSLEKYINDKAENGSFPAMLSNVDLDFVVASVNYQHDRGMMHTRMNLKLTWYDPRVIWDPTDHYDIGFLHYHDNVIWQPTLLKINSIEHADEYYNIEHRIKIDYNGTVTSIFENVVFSSWCPNAMKNWPNEHLLCDVIFGLDPGPLGTLDLIYDGHWAHPKIETLSEWTLKAITVSTVDNANNMRYTDKKVLQSMVGDIAIEFEIARNSRFYKNVFSMPILTCQVLIILSFLLRGYRRGALLLVVVMVLLLGLMFLTKHAPKPYVPPIMMAYQHILRVATFCYMLHICLMWLELYPPRSKPYNWLSSIVHFSPLRFALCMRLSDNDVFIGSDQQPWREVAKILNALCFVVINIIFIVVVVLLLPHV